MCLEVKGKVCTKCGVFKEFSEFCAKRASKDGFYNQCKICKNTIKNEKYLKIRQESHKFDSLYKVCPHCKQEKWIYNFSWKNKSKGLFNSFCKDCIKEKYYTGENKEKQLKQMAKYRENNRDKIIIYRSRPEIIKAMKDYQSRPDIVERSKKYNSRPDIIERSKKYNSRPDIVERKRKYNSRPELIAYKQTEEYKQKAIIYEQTRKRKY